MTLCCAAVNSMGTLINGADAGVAIISSAVAAANATLIRAHQVVGQVDAMANEWAQSPVGSIIGLPLFTHHHSSWTEAFGVDHGPVLGCDMV